MIERSWNYTILNVDFQRPKKIGRLIISCLETNSFGFMGLLEANQDEDGCYSEPLIKDTDELERWNCIWYEIIALYEELQSRFLPF